MECIFSDVLTFILSGIKIIAAIMMNDFFLNTDNRSVKFLPVFKFRYVDY